MDASMRVQKMSKFKELNREIRLECGLPVSVYLSVSKTELAQPFDCALGMAFRQF